MVIFLFCSLLIFVRKYANNGYCGMPVIHLRWACLLIVFLQAAHRLFLLRREVHELSKGTFVNLR